MLSAILKRDSQMMNCFIDKNEEKKTINYNLHSNKKRFSHISTKRHFSTFLGIYF